MLGNGRGERHGSLQAFAARAIAPKEE